MNRRSLLRRLSILIESNRIRATGAFKGRVYWPFMPESPRVAEPEESLIPLSVLVAKSAVMSVSRFSVANRSATGAIFSSPIPIQDRISTTPPGHICTESAVPTRSPCPPAPWPDRSWAGF